MDIKELELLKEKTITEYKIMKDPKYSEIHTLDNELATKLAEIDEQMNEVKRIKQFKAEIKKNLTIENGFTSTNYDALSDSDKLVAKEAIFEYYAEQVNVYYGLNTLEYLAVPLIKILAKCLDTSNLTTQEQAFFDRIITTINHHPMTIDNPDTWEFNIINAILLATINRRAEYIAKKIEITGSF